jgi:hypothetical protein
VVLAAIKEKDADVILEYAPLYLENYEWANNNPEEALLQTQMDFPRFMEERYYNEILRVATISAEYKAEQERKQKNAGKRMKRFRKKEMLGGLTTLKKGNRLTATQGISAQQLTDILTKCQTSAITLGEELERRQEAGEAIIHMLEEYCEALYLQSQNYGNEAVHKEFQAGIDAGAKIVMVSNAKAQYMTGDRRLPCSLSEGTVAYIRGAMGYEGILMTSSLSENRMVAAYNSEEAAVKAIVAGMDMILEPTDFVAAYEAILEAVNDGTISQMRLENAVGRILELKIE